DPATSRVAFTWTGTALRISTSCLKTLTPFTVTSRWYGFGGMLAIRNDPSEAEIVDCVWPDTALRIVTEALGRAPPDESRTIPWIVPALPSDWPKPNVVKPRDSKPKAETARIPFIGSSIGHVLVPA